MPIYSEPVTTESLPPPAPAPQPEPEPEPQSPVNTPSEENDENLGLKVALPIVLISLMGLLAYFVYIKYYAPRWKNVKTMVHGPVEITTQNPMNNR